MADRSARLAGALRRTASARGDVVMTLIGNRPEWVLTMVACFRIGAVALPCNEQLRAKDLAQRSTAARPKLIVADERNLERAARGRPAVPGAGRSRTTAVRDAEPAAPAVDLDPTDPCLITFTSGTTASRAASSTGSATCPASACRPSTGSTRGPGDLVWCTAASGWSKSARNVFIAPWMRGAAALLHDARFDPAERLEILAGERVNVLCMAPTEYRVIAKRATLRPLPALRTLVAAGEALNPEVLRAFREATGLEIRDGYGQTETGQLTGKPPGEPVRPGSMGRPLPGVDLQVEDGELVLADPTHRSHVLRRLPRWRARRRRTRRGAPATESRRTRTATCTSRGAPTT